MSGIRDLADVHQEVAEAVRELRPDIVNALQQIVRIPSQTGSEGAAQEAVTRLMRAHDLDVDIWEPDPVPLEPYADSVTLESDFGGRPNVVGVMKARVVDGR